MLTMRAVTADHPVDIVSELAANEVAKKFTAIDEERREQFLVGLMNSADGRRFVWDLIHDGGFFGTGERVDALAQWDTHRVAHALGVRHFSGLLWQNAQAACPELLAVMVTEAMDRLRAQRDKQ